MAISIGTARVDDAINITRIFGDISTSKLDGGSSGTAIVLDGTDIGTARVLDADCSY